MKSLEIKNPYNWNNLQLILVCLIFFCFICTWRRQWHPTPVLLLGKSHGRRSLLGCSPWGHYESDTTEQLHFHFSLSCIGEGNGNPLQCFCLENPRDGGAWWAAVYGVAQSLTRLKWLSIALAKELFIKGIYFMNKSNIYDNCILCMCIISMVSKQKVN